MLNIMLFGHVKLVQNAVVGLLTTTVVDVMSSLNDTFWLPFCL